MGQFFLLFLREWDGQNESFFLKYYETFKDIQITPRSVATHIKNRCRITYKRIII